MTFIEDQERAWKEIANMVGTDVGYIFSNGGTVNGPGSSMARAKSLTVKLPELLRRYNVKTMLDAPCGDLTWIHHTDLSFLDTYIGMDLHDAVIHNLRLTHYGDKQKVFVVANLLERKRFPSVDLILCRDFLAHLPNGYINQVIERFRASGSTYLLASNYPGVDNQYTYDEKNFRWKGYMERPHDLTQEPFNLKQIDFIPEVAAPRGVVSEPHELALFTL